MNNPNWEVEAPAETKMNPIREVEAPAETAISNKRPTHGIKYFEGANQPLNPNPSPLSTGAKGA